MAKQRKSGGNWVLGGILILVGIWFLLDGIGLEIPRMDAIWPIFPILGGLAFIIGYLTGAGDMDEGAMIPGIGGLLVGIFFFFITLGPLTWGDLSIWWPIFPLIGGIAFLATWLAGRMRDWGLLIPAFGGLGVGVVGLLVTTDAIEGAIVADWWPVSLILVGIILLAANLRRQAG
jgi:hypothetical protein